MTLKEFSKTYRYNPCYHNVGDNIVAFPCSAHISEERGFWSLTDYKVISVAGGTIWLSKKEEASS